MTSIHPGVSCGIPDFRSRDGLYASLKDRGEYDLDDPQQMYVENLPLGLPSSNVWFRRFDISYFRENPAGEPLTSAVRKEFLSLYSLLVSRS